MLDRHRVPRTRHVRARERPWSVRYELCLHVRLRNIVGHLINFTIGSCQAALVRRKREDSSLPEVLLQKNHIFWCFCVCFIEIFGCFCACFIEIFGRFCVTISILGHYLYSSASNRRTLQTWKENFIKTLFNGNFQTEENRLY